MIKKRPRYPAGYSVAGLAPISKALHAEEKCELYSLGTEGSEELILFVAQATESWGSDCKAMQEWWGSQPVRVIKVQEMLEAPAIDAS